MSDHGMSKAKWAQLTYEQKKSFLEQYIGTTASDSAVKIDPPVVDIKVNTTEKLTHLDEGVAIIGVAGYFPQATSIEEFWHNLCSGKDCIVEIPEQRWRWQDYFVPEKNIADKMYSKWGSFIDDADKFDPLFFNISPYETEIIDPQERLFLQAAWSAIEDSGRDPLSLKQRRISVHVGMMWNEYQLLYGDGVTPRNGYGNSNNSGLANRVSYFLDFSGPSLVIDTACSSSLVAVHMACESIRYGGCDYALAGGVNLSLHPSKYINLSRIGMLSTQGKCKSFGTDGDGYVPGEAVGVVFLKSLSRALEDGDPIHGVILSSEINHGGKTNGYTIPNPDAQAEVIKKALEKSAIHPESIGYIEAHGTGTALGDPIEITGLCKAFGNVPKDSCALGSVKSNLGHTEGAAGIVALIKVLLQLKYKQLVPSLHSEVENPYISFENTPFYVQKILDKWIEKPGYRHRAGVSSFGAGGSNAHLIVEASPELISSSSLEKSYYLMTLSAKHPNSLESMMSHLHGYLSNHMDLSLQSVAYTLNTGRGHFDHRFVAVASSIHELIHILQAAQTDTALDSYFLSKTKNEFKSEPVFVKLLENTLSEVVHNTISAEEYRKNLLVLADLYQRGYLLPWETLHCGEAHQRVHLPTYAFLKDRYWVQDTAELEQHVVPALQNMLQETDSPLDKTQHYLKEKIAAVLKLPIDRLSADESFDHYGIDSIMIVNLTRSLEEDLGDLPKTLFFEYRTINELVGYLLEHHHTSIFECLAMNAVASVKSVSAPSLVQPTTKRDLDDTSAIAIIGVAGRYPMAKTLTELWKNLISGKDCITEIPADRWQHELYFDTDREAIGKTYGKWGGFIEDHDKFDPLFFNISPREAEALDPQERLFLEIAWHTLEDAGYSPQSLQHLGKTGVFVGVMYGQYQLFGAEECLKGNPLALSSSYASIANRVSYYFNFQGPSMAIDTMCSSSLTAIHLACEHILRGRCTVALAGGVNIMSHPNKYLLLSQGQFLSRDGRCRSFGEGGTGYVPGEGVGAVLLTSLAQAIANGDRIYGVIRGSSINHGGTTNHYTVPNPVAQHRVVSDALSEANIPPESISYLETHGTGTSLGDPIEVRGLSKTFSDALPLQSCAIGSIKSNVGHLESAAGIVALTKVLLQFQHQTLVPSLHADTLNPYIDFENSPFYVQRNVSDWQPRWGYPRRAGISSFGAGGSNAHVILEEWETKLACLERSKPYYLVTLSAKHPTALKQRVADLHAHLLENTRLSIEAVANTLNRKRVHFDYRCALVVGDIQELISVLSQVLHGELGHYVVCDLQANTRVSCANSTEQVEAVLSNLTPLLLDKHAYFSQLFILAELYVTGGTIHWDKLHTAEVQQTISLPYYPFLKQRYWVPTQRSVPLLGTHKASAILSGDAFYLADHNVAGQHILPGVVYFELARKAYAECTTEAIIGLRNVIWMHPLVVDSHAIAAVVSIHQHAHKIEYVISTQKNGNEVGHSQGEIVCGERVHQEAWSSISALEQHLTQYYTHVELYQHFQGISLNYGPRFRPLLWVRTNAEEALGYYRLHDDLLSEHNNYLFHPSILDGALQASMAILLANNALSSLSIPFALNDLILVSAPPKEGYIHVKPMPDSRTQLSLQILDNAGKVCMVLLGLIARPWTPAAMYCYYPAWQSTPLSREASAIKSICVLSDDSQWLSLSQMSRFDVPVVLLRYGHTFAQIDAQIYQIQANEPNDYLQVLQSLQQQGIVLSHFVVAAGVDEPAMEEGRYIESVLPSVMFLLQSVIQIKAAQILHFCVPYYHDVDALQFTPMLAGFAKSVWQEHPNYQLHIVGLESATTKQIQHTQLIEELSASDHVHIRYQQGLRHIEYYQYEQKNTVNDLNKLKQHDVLLITGGVGGLGYIMAEHLAKTYQAKLVLTGRSSPTPEIRQKLANLTMAGAQAIYVEGDVCDRAVVKNWISVAKSQFGQLHGVIHSAGVLDDGFLFKKNKESLDKVLRPKVLGALNLDLATQYESLTCFILFSSIASCFGNVGQTDYAAANAFLDQFAMWRNQQVAKQQRHGMTCAINWPLWTDGGMRINEAVVQFLKTKGLEPLPSTLGLDAFSMCLNQANVSQCLILYGQQPKLDRLIQSVGCFRSTSVAVLDKPILTERFSEPNNVLQAIESEIIAGITEILKVESDAINVTKELISYGFDSVTFVRLANFLKKIYGVTLSPTVFFEYPSVQALTTYLWQTHKQSLNDFYADSRVIPTRLPQVSATEQPSIEKTVLDLSVGQRQLYATYLLNPHSTTYNIGIAAELKGALEIDVLKKALLCIVKRHDAMRMCFRFNQDNIQAIVEKNKGIDVPVRLIDSSENIDDVIHELHAKPFDLAIAPLFRCCLLQLSEVSYVLVYVVHHIITDGWSLGLLSKELMHHYNALLSDANYELATNVASYADFIEWQRADLTPARRQAILSFWKNSLIDPPEALQFPRLPRKDSTVALSVHEQRMVLSGQATEQLTQFSRTHGVSLFVTLLSAYQVLLARYANQLDLVVGIPFFSREEAQFEKTLGYFINTLPFRMKFEFTHDFVAIIQRNQSLVLAAQQHQTLPLAELIGALDLPRHTDHPPLFQVLFNFINISMPDLKLAGVQSSYIWIEEGQTDYELNMSIIEEKGKLELILKYQAALFDTVLIQQFLAHYATLLQTIILQASQPVVELCLLNETEKNELLAEWHPHQHDHHTAFVIPLLFEAQVEQTPMDVAVQFGSQQLTYDALNQKANQLAHFLREKSVGPNSIVAIGLERGFELVIGLLAILKAGGAYVPLDTSYPTDRIQFMLQDSQAHVLLTQDSLIHVDTLSPHIQIIDLGDDTQWKKYAVTNLNAVIQPTDLVYVMYTSGSTGTPKGVMMPHGALSNLLLWQKEHFIYQSPAKVLQFSAVSFDVCFQECFSTWITGGTLVLLSEAEKRDINCVLDILQSQKINRVYLPYIALSSLAEQHRTRFQVLDHLCELITAGEQLVMTPALQTFLNRHPNCALINQYGPTETHVVSSYWVQAPYALLPPIGTPIANVALYILDQGQQPVPIGVSGELYVGGMAVARGYHNRPDLTNERFIKHPFLSEGYLYRTGDWVRRLFDGNIEFLSRVDTQVKIRGFRIELGEIEGHLSHYSAIKQCAVVLRDEGAYKHLVLYYVPHTMPDELFIKSLHAYCMQKLPEYMIPTRFIQVDNFPLTPSGKTDRKALVALNQQGSHVHHDYVAPRNDIEQGLALIWSEILQVERLGVHDNFFSLGGHSLTATQVLVRIKNLYQLDLPFRSLFDHPTIETYGQMLCVALADQPTNPQLSFKEIKRGEIIPLSFAQQRLWFLDQLVENKAIYNIPIHLKLKGSLNISAMQQAVQTLVARHESLRTYCHVVESEPQQKVEQRVDLIIAQIDLTSLDEKTQRAELSKLVASESKKVFDLTLAPLMRMALARLSCDEHLLLITKHHIISDGWSIDIFLRELSVLYNSYAFEHPCTLSDNLLQYIDYTLWQRAWLNDSVLEEQLSYWKNKLHSTAGVLNLPTDKPRPAVATHAGRIYQFFINSTLTSQLIRMSEQYQVTLFMVLLALLKTMLFRYSYQEDMIVGSPIAGRQQKETEGILGLFINTLVLRSHLTADMTFTALLNQIKEVTLEAYAHQDLPFEQLVEHLNVSRQLDRHPLFQVMLILQNTNTPPIILEGLEVEPFFVDTQLSKFDLSFNVMPSDAGELRVFIEYSTDLFYEATIQRLASHFIEVITHVIMDPQISIGQINFLTEVERYQLLFQWNDTTVNFPETKMIHQLFEAQAHSQPDHIAVEFEDNQLSYAELNRQSNQLAHYLRKSGILTGDLVGISLERSLEMVISIVAILKVGAAYVPLDPSYPEDRLQFMLDDAQVKLLITHTQLHEKLLSYRGSVLVINEAKARLQDEMEVNLSVTLHPEDLAYVIYTSGSTGKPKGVMCTHQGLTNRILWMQQQYRLTQNDRVLQKTSFSFDVSVWEFCWPLIIGARLVVASPHIHKDPQALMACIRHYDITVMHFVPSMLYHFLANENVAHCRSLRMVFASGEALSYTLQQQFFQQLEAELHNLYGPTEASIDVSYWQCQRDSLLKKVPIGKPIANTQLYILDEYLQPVPVGVAGELYIGGIGLARGYLNRPELTRERFIASPFMSTGQEKYREKIYRTGDWVCYLPDGNIDYLGRIDTQIKLRGFRIELDEIQMVLERHADIEQAVVIVREDEIGDKQLIAYFVPTISFTEDALTNELVARIRNYVAEMLPDFMLPNVLMPLAALPLTASGKIDRKALPKPAKIISQNQYIPPSTEAERRLVSIWAALLDLNPHTVSVHDSFFDLGGHSLLIMRMLAEVKKQLQLEFTVRDFMSHPTIAQMTLLSTQSQSMVRDNQQLLISKMMNDAILPDDIKVMHHNRMPRLPKIILLTGATGFIGIHLLYTLLQMTSANVMCLVRAGSIAIAQEKLWSQLKKYQLLTHVNKARVHVVLGDLSLPNLGLTKKIWNQLVKQVDSIYHNGALVHHIYDYETLRAPNVLSTLALIKLAVTHKNKKLHFISTISAASKYDALGRLTESAPAKLLPDHFTQGYVQSKWVAERLIAQARKRGIQASIYRLGTVLGQQKSGIVNEGNHVTRLLKSCIQLGVAPDLVMHTEFTPVDVVSQAIGCLSLQLSMKTVYHLSHPQYIEWHKFTAALRQIGYDLKTVTPNEWQKNYLMNLPETNALYALAPLYLGDLDEHQDMLSLVSKTQAQLLKLDVIYPEITHELLIRYLNYLIDICFLPVPSQHSLQNQTIRIIEHVS